MRPSVFGLFLGWQCLTARADGQNLVEYALVIALVPFGCAATMQSLATGIHTEFSTVISVISSAMA